MDETTHKDALTFRLNENNKLLAVFEPEVYKVALDAAAIKEMLVQQNLSDLFLDEKALSRLVQMYNNTNAGFVLEIGERRDGEFTITVAKDKMSAWLTLTPAYGGAPVTFEQIRQSLKEKGIVSGLITSAEIEAVLKEGHATDYLIAQGMPPVPGLDAQFHSLVPEMQERRPQINEHGIADYRNLGNLILVKQGDPLMRRTLPTEGKKGKNILGQILTPKPSQNTPFASDLKGATFDPDDCDLLVSSIIGQPLLIPNGVMVSPTITVPKVDISTGNLSFDGTINILGDVMEGMKVYALNDIFIGGTVEAAELEAGGNISIKGGVIGNSDTNSSLAASAGGKISCKGSVSVRFAKYFNIVAGTNIVIEEYSMNNQLTAMNQILVGKPGGKKGLIIGGTARAMMLVQAASVGSDVGIKTYIQAGLNPHTQEQLNAIDREIETNGKNQDDIKKIITFIENNPEKDKNGLLNKARRTLDKLTTEIAQHQAIRESLLAEISFAEYAKVVVDHTLCTGVEVRIGDQTWKAKEERGKTVFRLIDKKISYGS
ncbi:MAG: FapA family protein [Methylobacter tundripaludum]|nr:FapA family protein [Methylobacter tundripaludum]